MSIDVEAIQPLFLNVSQASKVLGLGKTKMYELIKRRELPAVHVGRALRFYYPALQEWAKQQADKDE